MIGKNWNARAGVVIRYIVLGYHSRKGSSKGLLNNYLRLASQIYLCPFGLIVPYCNVAKSLRLFRGNWTVQRDEKFSLWLVVMRYITS